MESKIKRYGKVLWYGIVAGIAVKLLVGQVSSIAVLMMRGQGAIIVKLIKLLLADLAIYGFLGGVFAFALYLLASISANKIRNRILYYLIFAPVIFGILWLVSSKMGLGWDSTVSDILLIGILYFPIAIGTDYYFHRKYKQLNEQLRKAQQQ